MERDHLGNSAAHAIDQGSSNAHYGGDCTHAYVRTCRVVRTATILLHTVPVAMAECEFGVMYCIAFSIGGLDT